MEKVPKSVTIRDVARMAGVGVGTVSRVLNGGSNVHDVTRERVQAIIRHLGFRPHAQARRMSRRTEMVCFLMSNRDFLHSFHARILKGVETCARSLGQQVVFAVTHYDEKAKPEEILLPPILKERGWVDGLILAGTIYPNFIKQIQAMRVPFVMFGNNLFGPMRMLKYDQVGFDGMVAELEATKYVIEQGHQAIAFAADLRFPWFRRRFVGYSQAMKAKGLPLLQVTPRGPDSSSEYADLIAPKILYMNPRPTAVIAGNDEIAYGLWRSFRKAGVSVPEDISLVGFDDRDVATMMDPPLTTVRVHKEEIGEALMKMLIEKLKKPEKHVPSLDLLTELVVRGTVKRHGT